MDRDIVRGRVIKKILSVGNKKLCVKMFRLIFLEVFNRVKKEFKKHYLNAFKY